LVAEYRSNVQHSIMSYVTVEVEIDHGRIVPREPAKLPNRGKGFLTILSTNLPAAGLIATPQKEPRAIGLARGEFTVPDDFNAPLPEDVLKGFEGQ
jgi:hypothetical protein